MKQSITYLLFFFIISLNCEEFEKQDELLLLTDNNFHQALEQYEYLVVKIKQVEFMAPWCEACKLFTPELEKAAKTLSTHDPVVGVAMVDGTVNRRLTSEYNITSYPTMKFFIRGDALYYKLKVLSEQDVLDHVAENIGFKQNSPGKSKLVNSVEQLQQFNQSNSILVIYFGQEDENFQRFESLTKEMSDIFFGHSFSEPLMEQLQITKQPSLVMFKKVEEYRTDFTGPFNFIALENFVKHNKLGLLVRYKSEVKTYLEEEQKFILMLLYPRVLIKSEEAQNAKQAMQQVAYELKDQIIVGMCNMDEEDGKELIGKLGVKKGQQLLVRIFKVGKDKEMYEKYKLDDIDEINYENIMRFYQLWKDKKIKAYLKSGPAAKEEGLIKELTGDTFESIVYDKTKDVLVLYYSKSCNLCKKVEKVMEKAVEYYRDIAPDLIFAKINMDSNEIPEPLGTDQYPEVRFHTTRRKKGPAFWKKPFDFDNLQKFMKTKITVDVQKKKEKKKEEL